MYKNDIPKGANRIFKDCLNSFHVLTKDSAYQIVLYHDYISLYEPYDIHWFNQTIEACLFKKDRNLFFEFSTYQGYGHEIIYIDEINKTRNIFTKYVDTESYSSLLEDISAISSYYFLHSVVNTSTNDSLTISHINNFNRENRYIRKFENQTIKNTIRLINDTIIYFNYYESKIQYFSNLTVPPIDIDYQNTKG
ncbi:MAG: hypothetical protein B7C24_08665 [Bacteroidetes bacterium 4572_77]|nr:MAG: hypothetical protein B7C24_08665 [Bacteroidetes bacterium 4572_77]